MSGPDFTLEPDAAARVVNACYVLSAHVDALKRFANGLTSGSASGKYGSGVGVDKGLLGLGTLATKAIELLKEEIDKTCSAARAAGQRLVSQDDETQQNISRALQSPDGIDPISKLTTGMKEYSLPRSNDPLAGVSSMLKSHGAPQAGPFPMGVAPEPIPNFNLDPALAALGPAVPGTLTTLAQQWAQLAQQLQSAFSN